MLESRGKPREARPCSRSRNMMATVRSHGLKRQSPKSWVGLMFSPPGMDHQGLRKPQSLSSGSVTYAEDANCCRAKTEAGREVRGNDY